VTPFDLLFIACFLIAVVSLLRAAYHAARRRWTSAARVLRRLGYLAVVYVAVLVAVSLSSRRKVLQMGQRQCFDDWCVSVEHAERRSRVGEPPAAVEARGVFSVVTVRVSNAARRRAQRAADAGVFLLDEKGHRYDPSPPGQRALDATGVAGEDLTTRMPPGGSFVRRVVFDVPREAAELALVVNHGRFPGLLIIGDPQSFLHAPTGIRLSELDVP
jgi:hypothetical protein